MLKIGKIIAITGALSIAFAGVSAAQSVHSSSHSQASTHVQSSVAASINHATSSHENQKSSSTKKDVSVLVNGKQLNFDVPPVIKDGRTLIPVRGVSEALNATVSWDQTTQTVTITRDGTTIKLTIGQNVALVNGQSVQLDVPSYIANGRTLVPVRFVSEILKAKVDWSEANQTVSITDDEDTSDTSVTGATYNEDEGNTVTGATYIENDGNTVIGQVYGSVNQ